MGKKNKLKGIDLWLQDSQDFARKETARGLKERLTLPMIQDVASSATGFAADRVGEAMNGMPPERPLACMEGCSWCCSQTVLVNAAEVLAIAEHIRSTFPADEVAAVKDRLLTLEENVRGMSDDKRKVANLPCALLVDGRCSVYKVRPLVCAGYNSYDASICERATKGLEALIPWYGIQVVTFMRVGEGVKQGLAQVGLTGATLELTAALRIALNDPNAAERFLAKEPIFKDAKAKDA